MDSFSDLRGMHENQGFAGFPEVSEPQLSSILGFRGDSSHIHPWA